MGYAKVSVGRGCCPTNMKKRRIAKFASFCLVAVEMFVLVAYLFLNQGLKPEPLKKWQPDHEWMEIAKSAEFAEIKFRMKVILGAILSLHLIMLAFELKAFLRPDDKEKFSLTIRGSHERKPSRRRKTFYGVTVSDEVRVDYDRNSEGLQVYFRKVSTRDCPGPSCQPFMLPFRGWFTFFHIIIAFTLITCDILMYYSVPSLFIILISVAFLLQCFVVTCVYFTAEDCGFCFLFMMYTRWFKHMNSYTDMLQERIREKHGERLKKEGDELEVAIRKNMQTRKVNEVTVEDVDPHTVKRYEDQLVLLHLLLAQEHDRVCKQVFPDYDVENKGVSFTLTSDEIDTLVTHAEKDRERVVEVVEVDDLGNGGGGTEMEVNRSVEIQLAGNQDVGDSISPPQTFKLFKP